MSSWLISASILAALWRTARDNEIGLVNGTRCLQVVCLSITHASAPVDQSKSSSDSLPPSLGTQWPDRSPISDSGCWASTKVVRAFTASPSNLP